MSRRPAGFPVIIELWNNEGTKTRAFSTAQRKPGLYADVDEQYEGTWTCPVCCLLNDGTDYAKPCDNCGWGLGWEVP